MPPYKIVFKAYPIVYVGSLISIIVYKCYPDEKYILIGNYIILESSNIYMK